MNILWQNLRLNNWWNSIIINKLVYLIMCCCYWICIYSIVNICYILGSCLCWILKSSCLCCTLKSWNLRTCLISVLKANILSAIMNLLKLLGHLTCTKIWKVRLIKLSKLLPHNISGFWRIHISLLLWFTCVSSIQLIFSSTILYSKIWLIITIINIIIWSIAI